MFDFFAKSKNSMRSNTIGAAAPIVLDLILFLDLAKKSNMSGIQEWLSFYFKSPMALPGLDPEHDIFVQLAKLKNTLRHIMGEELITHLGQDK